MTTNNAISKLTKAGYTIIKSEFDFIIAHNDNREIRFDGSQDTVKSKGFTVEANNACSATYGVNRKTAMS